MMITQIKKWLVFLTFGLVICVIQSTAISASIESQNPSLTMEDETLGEISVPEPNLPEDRTPRVAVREILIIGNTLISDRELLERLPQYFNASDKPLLEAESQYLYDFTNLQMLLLEPGQEQEVSLRTIQGLTLYVLSAYKARNYAGIYVYVPEGTITGQMKLVDGVLTVKVIEAPVGEVNIKYFGADQNEVEAGLLRRSAFENWSPVKVGKVANQKSLDYFVNLLNLNPDRYISVMVSKGGEPNTLKIQYDIFETDPWHYFIQVDNSGTNERQWSPRIGLINTNLLGFDDRFTAVYQAKPDATIDDDYSVFGSYDFPVMGPRLRLNIYAGHSEFDINPEGGLFNFLGRGTFYGAMLRYNAYQHRGWFFDVTGSLSHERSKVTPSLFPTATSDVEMDLFGIGAELRRTRDMSNTTVSVNRQQSIDGSNSRRFNLARTQADPDFSIYTVSASHSRYLDQNKYHQLRGNCRLVTSDERLVSAKMTSFGGMYSVRGYDEYEVVADGGLLASIQYEFDWLRYNEAIERDEMEDDPDRPANEYFTLSKLTPLLFTDYGRSDMKDPVAGEKDSVTLWSVGVGTILEFGDNLSAACYYGYPLRKTDGTRRGKGRISVGFMLRW